MSGQKYFSGKSPCKDCPYRTDVPLKKWDKAEFIDLLAKDKEQFGAVYLCHKKNGTGCKGFLINQWERNIPSLKLRIALMQQRPPVNYMSTLKSKVNLYPSIEAMAEANYPELKQNT